MIRFVLSVISVNLYNDQTRCFVDRMGKYFSSLLGGEYAISNIKTAPLVELVRLSGDIGRQIKDLPDGAQIELKVVE